MGEVTQEVKPDTQVIQEKTEVQNTQHAPIEKQISEENEINWKKFREEKERQRKLAEENAKRAAEKEAEVSALKAALEVIVNKPNQNMSHAYEEEETEDQRIEKKVQAIIAQKESQKEKERAERERHEFPEKLRSDFKDFDQVISPTNLDYLDYHYPELTRPFAHMPDGYEKWSCIYKTVKKFVPNTEVKKEVAKMEKNLSKPQAINTTETNRGGTVIPSYKDNESQRAANWARMQKIMKGIS